MDYVNLGRTGVKVSPLCLGCMNFGLRTTEEESIPIIHKATEEGINFIDTANIYGHMPTEPPFGEGRGRSEEILGVALKQLGNRDRLIVATKVHANMNPDDPNASGLSRKHIIAEVENSLNRLQTDYIDLYQLHQPRPEIAIDETLQALDDLIRSGKVRYIGTSNFAAWQISDALATSREMKLNRFVSEQPIYNLCFRRAELELIPLAEKHEIALLPWSPLFGGFLTGKYRRDEPYPKDSRFTTALDWGSRLDESAYDLIDALLEMAEEKNCTVSQLALAWLMAQPAVTSPIIGPRTLDQLDDNLGALNIVISDEDKERLDKVSPARRTLLKLWPN